MDKVIMDNNFQDNLFDSNKYILEKNKNKAAFKVFVTNEGKFYLDVHTYVGLKKISENYKDFDFMDDLEKTIQYINRKPYVRISKEIIELFEKTEFEPNLQAVYYKLIKENHLSNYKINEKNENEQFYKIDELENLNEKVYIEEDKFNNSIKF